MSNIELREINALDRQLLKSTWALLHRLQRLPFPGEVAKHAGGVLGRHITPQQVPGKKTPSLILGRVKVYRMKWGVTPRVDLQGHPVTVSPRVEVQKVVDSAGLATSLGCLHCGGLGCRTCIRNPELLSTCCRCWGEGCGNCSGRGFE